MAPHWIKSFHRIKSWFLDWNLGPHLQASVTFSIMVAILSCTTSAVSRRSQGFLNIQLVLASHLFSFSPSYMEQSLHTLNTLPILQAAIQNTQPVTYSILRDPCRSCAKAANSRHWDQKQSSQEFLKQCFPFVLSPWPLFSGKFSLSLTFRISFYSCDFLPSHFSSIGSFTQSSCPFKCWGSALPLYIPQWLLSVPKALFTIKMLCKISIFKY